MNFPINKIGNIEIQDNVLRYRIPITEVEVDELVTIEKNFKRKFVSLEGLSYYLKPFDFQIVNSSLIYYYELDHYKSFDYIKQLTFKEKLKYFLSLVEIAKRQNETKVLWDQRNFVVDPHEEIFKVVIFETPDTKIFEKEDEFKGIKDLIVLSLTTLNVVLGKPKLQDFIDTGHDIIQFTEQVLKIDNLEDLGHYISTLQIEYEHVVESSKNKESFSNQITKISGKIKKENKPKKRIIRKNASGDTNLRKWIIIGAFVIPIGIFLNIFAPDGDGKKAAKETDYQIMDSSEESNKITDKKYNNQLLEAYRLSLEENYDEAIKILESIGYDNLSKTDKEITQEIYEKADQMSKVIELNPKKAKDIVNAMIANKENTKLLKLQKDLKTPNPYVDFEIAFLDQDWKKIIELKDKIELNGRKEEQIIEAYIGLQEFKEGQKFAEKVGNPILLDRIKSLSSVEK
ncbi:hypothetical protein KM915_20965 [Cytobacillus oceanisediminis]|uniref:hypothetical protein n=1 Tax=Cytobacillus oceanisediminis TaxID=665099 RepID=UPI001C23E973|nr:hypothetical protein [Cytobacillus oceanisediminis]MBU8732523.1 hypothetical protein [Cytobacillus oceanisediminis]